MTEREIYANLAVEGSSDELVLRAVLSHVAITPLNVVGLRGKAHLDVNLRKYNAAARTHPFVVVRDLDHDADCGAELISRLLPARSRGMAFRVAVREVESWILADARGLAAHFSIPATAIPHSPDDLAHPKTELVEVLRRSRRRDVRERMTPLTGTTARVGPEYSSGIAELIEDAWSIERALDRSPSLARCVRALRSLKRTWTEGQRNGR